VPSVPNPRGNLGGVSRQAPTEEVAVGTRVGCAAFQALLMSLKFGQSKQVFAASQGNDLPGFRLVLVVLILVFLLVLVLLVVLLPVLLVFLVLVVVQVVFIEFVIQLEDGRAALVGVLAGRPVGNHEVGSWAGLAFSRFGGG